MIKFVDKGIGKGKKKGFKPMNYETRSQQLSYNCDPISNWIH